MPLTEFASNLVLIITYIISHGIQNVLIMTPPPVDETQRKMNRSNNVTRLYAEAAQQAAAFVGVPCLDLWLGLQVCVCACACLHVRVHACVVVVCVCVCVLGFSLGLKPCLALAPIVVILCFLCSCCQRALCCWHVMHTQDIPDWSKKYLSDALHLTPLGNARLFGLLQTALDEHFPQLRWLMDGNMFPAELVQ